MPSAFRSSIPLATQGARGGLGEKLDAEFAFAPNFHPTKLSNADTLLKARRHFNFATAKKFALEISLR